MGKELLCRAKRMDTGEWIEGYYFKSYGCRNGKRYDVHIIYNYDTDENYIIDIDTLCQYTGKKVRDIKCFAGDIISTRRGQLLVDWDEDILTWTTYHFDEVGNPRKFCPLCDLASWEICDIRYNIFDNPEIIGGVNNG